MEECSSCIRKTTAWIKSVSSGTVDVKKNDVKMVVKILVLTLVTRAKLYKKLLSSGKESRYSDSKSASKINSESTSMKVKKAEKLLSQALSLIKKYIPE
jgi:hypothetical protein